MLELLEPGEWDEVQAYYDDEPFGEHAADVRAAKLAGAIEPSIDLEQFMKTPGERRRENSGEGPSGEATDAMFAVLIAKQKARGAKG